MQLLVSTQGNKWEANDLAKESKIKISKRKRVQSLINSVMYYYYYYFSLQC